MAEGCSNTEFSLKREEGDAIVEGVAMFNYLGRTLYKTDDYWTVERQNIMRARSVWWRLVTLLRQEEKNPRVLGMFYREVAQAILLYDLETWVLLEKMEKKVEGSHTDFLSHITVNQDQRVVDRTWETPGTIVVQEAAGTQLAMTYI